MCELISSFPYKHTAKPRSDIANELKVDAWVEGSVVRTGNRVRIAERVVQSRTMRKKEGL